MKPENIPGRKQPVSGEHIHAFDTSPPPSEREVRCRGHWRSGSTDILINRPDGSKPFESSCGTDDNDIIRPSSASTEVARSGSSSEQVHAESASTPIEGGDPLLPTDVPVPVGSERYPSTGKHVWYRIRIGEYAETHFFFKDGQKALAMPLHQIHADTGSKLLKILKVAMAEHGHEDADESSTMLEFTEKPTGGVDIALILFSELPRDKKQAKQHPKVDQSTADRYAGRFTESSRGNEPVPSTELDHGNHSEGASAEQHTPEEGVVKAVAPEEGTDKALVELGQTGHLGSDTKPSLAALGAAVVAKITGRPVDELSLSTGPTVELTAKVMDEVDAFKEQFGGKKLFAKMELEAEGQTCSKISEGVWPSNDPVEPPPPTSVTVKVVCNGFKFNERVVYFNEVSEHRLTGLKREAFFEQGMHLDLIRDCAGRPDRILNAKIREETRKNKVVCHLESLELIDSSGDDYALTQY